MVMNDPILLATSQLGLPIQTSEPVMEVATEG